MILDQALLNALRLRQRLNAGVRFNTLRDEAGRVWPLYHTRAVPETGISGVPVLFFHGFGNDSHTWFPLFSLLGSNRELVAVDLPAFGRHDPRDGDIYTPLWYAETCSSLVRELAVRWGQPPILVGKSMGGMIAGLVAARIPDLCRALVLIDPGGVLSPRLSHFWEEYERGRNLLLPQDNGEWESMIEVLYHRPRRIPGFVRRSVLKQIARDREHLERVFARLLDGGMNPLGERLAEIRCPVTLIWGEEDRVMDPSALSPFKKGLSGTAKRVDLIVLKGCGHSPTTEALPETRSALLGVFSRYG